MFGSGGFDASQAAAWTAQQQQTAEKAKAEGEDEDASNRPPNAFILYSQAMRSSVRQQNPSLSNTEVSRVLGKMWKEIPSDVKIGYKQRAAALQDEFKRAHPDYTYRKARRKRALNELLTKTGAGFAQGFPQGQEAMNAYQQMFAMQQQYAAMSGATPGGNTGGMPGVNPAFYAMQAAQYQKH
jgi:hypothetical protein